MQIVSSVFAAAAQIRKQQQDQLGGGMARNDQLAPSTGAVPESSSHC
jgi:hypothetical protein